MDLEGLYFRYKFMRNLPTTRLYFTLQCMTASEILETYHVTYKDGISEHLFLDLCPAIIYQIDKHMCAHGHHDDHDHDHVHVSNRSIAASYSMLQVAPEGKTLNGFLTLSRSTTDRLHYQSLEDGITHIIYHITILLIS